MRRFSTSLKPLILRSPTGRSIRVAKRECLRARMTSSFCFLMAALIGLTSLGSSNAEAYIPRSQTIFARTARNGGKGAYVIEQEVQFRSLAEPVTLRERWVVENGENMRLTAYAPKGSKDPARLDVLYRDGRKTSPDGGGSLQVTPLSPEFIENFEHYRSGRGLMDALVHAKILPPAFLREHAHPTAANIATFHPPPDPFVRLGRTGGVVSWIFGEPTPVESPRLNPEAWVEQDVFVLHKLRFPSQSEVVSDRFAAAPGNLRLPRERTVTWNSNVAVIRVLSVKPIAPLAATKALAQGSITTADARAARLPEIPAVKEFYARFR